MKRRHFLSQVRLDENQVQKARWKILRLAFLALFAIFVWGALASRAEARSTQEAKSAEVDTAPKATPTPVPESNSAAGSGAISFGWPSEIQKLADIIASESSENGIDPNLMAAVIFVESWFNPDNSAGYERCPEGPSTSSCTSRSGALGPAQVMPFHFKGEENGRDLRTNIGRGAEILSQYTARMESTMGGLAAYYCGPNAANWVDPAECWRYANKVLNVYDEKTN